LHGTWDDSLRLPRTNALELFVEYIPHCICFY